MKGKYTVICYLSIISCTALSPVQGQEWTGRNIATNCYADGLRPMAVGVYDLYANKTFTVFKGQDGDPYIIEINHANNQLSDAVKVGIIELEKDDTHNYPQICQSNDGYLHVFFADRYSTVIRYSRSKKPHSIEEWEVGPTVYRGDYPMVFKARNGNLYLFYRKNLQNNIDYFEDGSYPYRHQYYIKSADNGRTWSGPMQALIRWDTSDHMNEFYLGNIIEAPYRPGVPDMWHFAWVLSGGEVHDQYQKDLYHAVFNPDNDHFYNAGGSDLGEFIDQDEMEDNCLVFAYDPTPQKSYINPVSVDDQGVPRVDMYFKWTGQTWTTFEAKGLGDEITCFEWDNGKMYAYGGGVDVYESSDKGDTWKLAAGYAPPKYVSGAGKQTVPINQPAHPKAKLWTKETATGSAKNNVTIGGHTSSGTSRKLIMTADPARLKFGNITVVRVYICDEYNARIPDASARITCSIEGNGSLVYPSIYASDGMAVFYYKAGSSEGSTRITAESANLSDGTIEIYVRSDGLETGIDEDTIQIPPAVALIVTPSSRSVSSVSGSTTFTVVSEADWTVSESSDWLTATKTNATTLTVSYDENSSLTNRSASIAVSGDGAASQSVTINQAGTSPSLSIEPASRSVDPTAGSVTFTITSNIDWSVSESSDWLSAAKTNASTLTVTYSENPVTAARSADITVSGNGVSSQVATVNQAGANPYLDISPSSKSVSAAAGTATFSVSANIDWSASESADWLSASKTNSSTLTVEYTENKSSVARSAVITLSGTDVTSQSVTVEQSGAAVTSADMIIGDGTGMQLVIFPNPFHDYTWIAFTVPGFGNVIIDLIDMEGRVVKTILNAPYSAGNHTVYFSENILSKGIYFCRLNVDGVSKMVKMVVR